MLSYTTVANTGWDNKLIKLSSPPDIHFICMPCYLSKFSCTSTAWVGQPSSLCPNVMGWGADNFFFLQDIALQISSSQVRAVHSKQRHNRVVFWLRACSNQLSDRNPRHSISEKRNVHLTCTRGISSLLCNWLMSPPSSWPSIQGNVSKYDAGGARQHRLLYIMIFFGSHIIVLAILAR